MTSSPIAGAGGANYPLVSGEGLLKDQNRGSAQLLAARVCFMASGYLVSGLCKHRAFVSR